MTTSTELPTGNWILIVEDDASISEAISMGLQLEGYSALTAGNGKIGLQKLAPGHLPSLIFLDLNMPDMDGQQFLAELHSFPSLTEIPVVLVTAFTEKAEKIAGKVGILKKPIDLQSLLDFAKRFCGS